MGPVYVEKLSIDRPKRRIHRSRSLALRDAWPILRATDPAEAKSAVTWATEQGALGIAIDGPLEAVKAALQERSLPVRALHRPWLALPGDPDELKERTIEKVIVDCLSPTNPGTFDLVSERLKRFLALPGLAGVLLRDAVPPGYRFVNDKGNATALLGYTERNRQGFLKEYQRDIFDVAPGYCPYALKRYAPWVDLYGEPEWAMWRVDKVMESLNHLRLAITSACPMWLEGGLGANSYLMETLGTPLPGWLVLWTIWKEEDEHFLWDLYYPSEQKLIVTARNAGQNPWLLIPIPKGSPRAAIEERLGKLELETGEGWQGRYLDLSELSLDEARELFVGT
ncbi:MAG: hypothetical protein QM758_04765 [Armatimonas sp.]